jgi:hypothetical protein
VPNFKELGFKVGPTFIGQNRLFSTPIQNSDYAMFKTSIFIGVGSKQILTQPLIKG